MAFCLGRQVADTLKAGGNAESAVHIIQHIILAHGLLIGISWEVHLEGMIQVYLWCWESRLWRLKET